MRAKSNSKGSGVLLVVLLVVAIFVFGGCQKVIDIDLADSSPRLVVDGLVSDSLGPYRIRLSLSGCYFDQPALLPVSGAVVIISDNAGMTDSLKELSSGIYQTSKIRGIPGKTYRLKVLSDHKQYEGSSTMRSHVKIDSLTIEKGKSVEIEFDGMRVDNRAEIHCYFKDPGEKNYYRIRVCRNNTVNPKRYILYDDQYTNGEVIKLQVSRVRVGDVVRVDLISLDKPTYEYYRALRDILHSNPIFGSTPANPNTNLTNGAMGYFGACAISSKTIEITDALFNSLKLTE
jgi:hypothetical protein